MRHRKPLTGRVIAVPEARELERLSAMLEAKGATTLRYPLVATSDALDTGAVEAWLRELASGHLQDLVLMTAEGVRRLQSFSQRNGSDLALKEAMARVRTVTRGPKTARALRELGILPHIATELPTTEGVIEALAEEDLAGRTIGVQLCGQEPNQRLVRFLERAGAKVRAVAPYVYVRAIDDDRAFELIRRLARGGIDTIAFTSSRQVSRLFEVAASRNETALLSAGLTRTRIATVGPIVANALRNRGFHIDIVPRASFAMRSLVNEMVYALR
jgi:uroporphyrinogen-III synthase